MIPDGRFEYKYSLNVVDYLKLKNRLASTMRLDQFSTRADNGRYYIRSLYFDSYDYRAYVEKMDGNMSRIKLRVRSYFKTHQDCPFVSVELKCRRADKIIKFSKHVPLADFESFMARGYWDDDKDPVLQEFDRLRRLSHLEPKVLVDYYREAFVTRDRSDIRITFDHDICSSLSGELFPAASCYRKDLSHRVVLEIKTAGQAPQWLEKVVKQHNLKMVPNSKYAQCIERTQHALFI